MGTRVQQTEERGTHGLSAWNWSPGRIPLGGWLVWGQRRLSTPPPCLGYCVGGMLTASPPAVLTAIPVPLCSHR